MVIGMIGATVPEIISSLWETTILFIPIITFVPRLVQHTKTMLRREEQDIQDEAWNVIPKERISAARRIICQNFYNFNASTLALGLGVGLAVLALESNSANDTKKYFAWASGLMSVACAGLVVHDARKVKRTLYDQNIPLSPRPS